MDIQLHHPAAVFIFQSHNVLHCLFGSYPLAEGITALAKCPVIFIQKVRKKLEHPGLLRREHIYHTLFLRSAFVYSLFFRGRKAKVFCGGKIKLTSDILLQLLLSAWRNMSVRDLVLFIFLPRLCVIKTVEQGHCATSLWKK